MKFFHCVAPSPGSRPSVKVKVPAGWKSRINQLIAFHFLVFLIYLVSGRTGLLESPLAGGTVSEFIRHSLDLSSRSQDLRAHWWSSIFTYQFVHFRAGELILSMSMLWLFGHILAGTLGMRRVIRLYFISVTVSAIVFILSHLIFPVFSGPNGVMEGAFGGVLGLMTVTVFLYGRHRLHIGHKLQVPLRTVYLAALFLSLILVYKHNIAYILVYVSAIYAGFRYAEIIKSEPVPAAAGTEEEIPAAEAPGGEKIRGVLLSAPAA